MKLHQLRQIIREEAKGGINENILKEKGGEKF